MATDIPSNQAPISTDEHVDSRDFRIVGIDLIGADGVFRDISKLVIELQVRQDMYLGFMSGEAIINDGSDMHSQAALHGNEYIYIHITEPEQQISINKAFRVYKVGDRSSAQNNSQRYTIYFVSDEMMTAHLSKISKAYKATTISDIASDIMKNYLNIPTDRIIVDPTTSPVDVIIPNFRPTEALNWLASRAFDGKDACWFFYENLNGYNFRSINSIYKDGTVIKVPFKFEQKSVDKQIGMDKYAIDSFDAKRDFDSLKVVSTGGVAMKLLGVDIFEQSLKTNEYGMDDLTTLYKNPPTTNPKVNGKTLFDQSDTYFLTALQTGSNYIESWIKRIMHLSNLSNNLLELVLPGSVRLQAGTLINLKFPYAGTPAEGDMWDKRKGGKYLIIAVNHKFDLVDHKFDTIIMVSRDSIPESLPNVDSSLPSKILKINAKANKE